MHNNRNETDRVRRHTAPGVLMRIDGQIEANIQRYRGLPGSMIEARIRELEQEWSMERYLETNAAAISLAGVVLAATVNRKWLLLPGAVAAFLLQHAIQGWCPPVPVFRRMGVRTRGEIDREVHALKAMRGDYRDLQPWQGRADGLTTEEPAS